MQTLLFHYEMLPTTWFYLSSLMIIAIFFRFDRFWSVRNLDLIALMLFTPGILSMDSGIALSEGSLVLVDGATSPYGYVWLFGVGLYFVVRLLLDPLLSRRPLLEPNLSAPAMTFTCVALLLFLFGGLIVGRGSLQDLGGMVRLDQRYALRDRLAGRGEAPYRSATPGFPPFQAFAASAEISLSPAMAPSGSRVSFPRPSEQEDGLGQWEDTSGADPATRNREGPSPEVDATPLQDGVFPFDNGNGAPPEPSPDDGLDSPDGRQNGPPDGSVAGDSPDWAGPDALAPTGDRPEGDARTAEDSATTSSAPESAVPGGLAIVTLHRPTSFWFDLFALVFAIAGLLGIVAGIIIIGYRHFGNFQTGIAAGALYLLLPYTSQMPGRIDHTIPGALLLWAVITYRTPLLSGSLLGLASGLVFYPIFLLPLWCSFYWRRGLIRFAIGFVVTLALFFLLLAFSPGEFGGYGAQLGRTFGLWSMQLGDAEGFWQLETRAYRIPVFAVFAALSLSLALWPAQKNLGTLMGCTAVVMLATQYWQAHQGGLYMAWYLPLLVMTIFRPNLENRTALTSVRLANPWAADVRPRAGGG